MNAPALLPSARLLAKVGSLVGHVEEYFGPGGHQFDRSAIDALLADEEVREWMGAMRDLALVPEPRRQP